MSGQDLETGLGKRKEKSNDFWVKGKKNPMIFGGKENLFSVNKGGKMSFLKGIIFSRAAALIKFIYFLRNYALSKSILCTSRGKHIYF